MPIPLDISPSVLRHRCKRASPFQWTITSESKGASLKELDPFLSVRWALAGVKVRSRVECNECPLGDHPTRQPQSPRPGLKSSAQNAGHPARVKSGLGDDTLAIPIHDGISVSLDQATATLTAFVADERNLRDVDRFAELVAASLRMGGRIYACGNAGSISDAMHFAEEHSGCSRKMGRTLHACLYASLTEDYYEAFAP